MKPMTRIRNHPLAALGVLVLGLFMTLLDLTIVNIAIPSILDGLHASLDQVLWVLNAYSLLYGVLTFALAMLLIPDLRPGRKHRLDLVGVALATAGLLGVIFGLIEGQRYDWGVVTGSITIPKIIAAGVVLLAVFLVYQARRQGAEPLLPFAVFKDRNFTLMTFVMAAMGFAILGLYLPLTIYLQSVLGLSAIDAGLTIALQPLAMIVSSGVASSLVQKVNGKYLLIPGLLVLAAGSGYIDWAAHADSGRWDFAAGLILSGLGMGCIWTPVFSIGTRDLRPDLAGVASGVINTIQELGGVLASAVVGAFLQNRLALALHDQAVAASGRLPEQYRAPFINGFSNAAHTGFEVGAGQSGTSLQLPAQVDAIAHYVFAHGFVDAMHPTLLLPIAILLVAALASAFVRGPQRPALSVHDEEAAVA